jgi:glycosyltransferase involved in cell wall biosynthesis
MKVFFCQPTLNRSGSEKSLLQLLRALKNHPAISSLHVLAGEDGAMKTALEQYAQIQIVNAPKLRRTWRSIGAFIGSFGTMYWALRSLLNGGDAVVYVNTLMFPQATIAAYLNGRPAIVHIREVATTYPPGVYRLYSLIAAICASKLVAPCSFVFTQRQIPTFAVQPKRRHVIYNAAAGCKEFLPRHLVRPFKILAVMPCTVRKGVFDLVNCIKHLKRRLPEDGSFEVDVVGSLQTGKTDTFERVKQRLREDGTESHVEFHGEVEDVDRFFLDAHAFLHPSHSECFPRVLVEACGFSLPCVATNVGGVSELVINGLNGYLVPVGASEEMADRLVQLVTDTQRYSASAKRAFESFQERHSIGELGRRSAELLAIVIDEHNAA